MPGQIKLLVKHGRSRVLSANTGGFRSPAPSERGLSEIPRLAPAANSSGAPSGIARDHRQPLPAASSVPGQPIKPGDKWPEDGKSRWLITAGNHAKLALPANYSSADVDVLDAAVRMLASSRRSQTD